MDPWSKNVIQIFDTSRLDKNIRKISRKKKSDNRDNGGRDNNYTSMISFCILLFIACPQCKCNEYLDTTDNTCKGKIKKICYYFLTPPVQVAWWAYIYV